MKKVDTIGSPKDTEETPRSGADWTDEETQNRPLMDLLREMDKSAAFLLKGLARLEAEQRAIGRKERPGLNGYEQVFLDSLRFRVGELVRYFARNFGEGYRARAQWKLQSLIEWVTRVEAYGEKGITFDSDLPELIRQLKKAADRHHSYLRPGRGSLGSLGFAEKLMERTGVRTARAFRDDWSDQSGRLDLARFAQDPEVIDRYFGGKSPRTNPEWMFRRRQETLEDLLIATRLLRPDLTWNPESGDQ